MRPTRFDLMLQVARDFISEWFDQNPLGQIGIVGMRAGLGERIGEMSGKTTLVSPFIFMLKHPSRKSTRSSQIDIGQNQA